MFMLSMAVTAVYLRRDREGRMTPCERTAIAPRRRGDSSWSTGSFRRVWILLTSLKRESELVAKPITYLPRHLTLDNYVQAFTDQPLLRYLGNSFTVALLSTIRRWPSPRWPPTRSRGSTSGAASSSCRASSPPACFRW